MVVLALAADTSLLSNWCVTQAYFWGGQVEPLLQFTESI